MGSGPPLGSKQHCAPLTKILDPRMHGLRILDRTLCWVVWSHQGRIVCWKDNARLITEQPVGVFIFLLWSLWSLLLQLLSQTDPTLLDNRQPRVPGDERRPCFPLVRGTRGNIFFALRPTNLATASLSDKNFTTGEAQIGQKPSDIVITTEEEQMQRHLSLNLDTTPQRARDPGSKPRGGWGAGWDWGHVTLSLIGQQLWQARDPGQWRLHPQSCHRYS